MNKWISLRFCLFILKNPKQENWNCIKSTTIKTLFSTATLEHITRVFFRRRENQTRPQAETYVSVSWGQYVKRAAAKFDLFLWGALESMGQYFFRLWVWLLIGSQVCFWWVLTRQTHQFVLFSSGLEARLNLHNLCPIWKGLLKLAIKVCCVWVPVNLCRLPVLRWPSQGQRLLDPLGA